MQAQMYDSSQKPLHIVNMLQDHIQDVNLCTRLATVLVLQSMLNPELNLQLTLDQLVVELMGIFWGKDSVHDVSAQQASFRTPFLH